MICRSAVTALFVVQLFACAVSAQQSSEFARASSGEIVMTPKGSAKFSGSLEVSTSRGGDVFGRGDSTGYGVTAGGTLLQDRLWFFGSATRQSASAARWQQLELPENATSGAIGARVSGQLAGGHDFSAFFQSARQPELSNAFPSTLSVVPSTFLALRYTGVITPNMFFTASVTRSERSAQSMPSILPQQ